MITLVQSENIPVITGTLLPFGDGPLATQIQQANENAVNTDNLDTGYFDYIGVGRYTDYAEKHPTTFALNDYGVLMSTTGVSSFIFDEGGGAYNPAYTDDGVHVNQAGADALTRIVEPEIAGFMVGGVK